MFEVRVFVDDKKLAKLLWTLDGLITGQPDLLPVRGAKEVKTKTGTKVKGNGGQTLKAKLIQALSERDNTRITTKELGSAIVELGGAKTSAGAYTTGFVNAKFLKRLDQGVYEIHRDKMSAAAEVNL